MSEVARAAVVFARIPVVGEFDFRFGRIRSGDEDERVFTLLAFLAARFDQAESFAVETQRRVEIAHAHHRVQITHVATPV